MAIWVPHILQVTGMSPKECDQGCVWKGPQPLSLLLQGVDEDQESLRRQV